MEAGIKGVDRYPSPEVIYWLHQSRRDLVVQSPKNDGAPHGTFSLRSPVRPNPLGTSLVQLVGASKGRRGAGACARYLRRDAAARHQAKPLPVHAAPAPPQDGDFEGGGGGGGGGGLTG